MGKGSKITGRQIAIYAGAALGLAAVIFGIAAISSPDSSKTQPPQTQLSSTVQAAQLAQDAASALSRNETATAVALAKRALVLDSANVDAQRVIDTAQADTNPGATSQGSKDGASPATSKTSTTAPKPKPKPKPTPPLTPDKYLEPIADLETLLPASIEGWNAGSVVVQGADAVATFEPKTGTPASKQVVRALVSVHDRKTSEAALVFVKKVDKRVYSEDAGVVVVSAVPDAYFGTDGSRIAAIAFARGRYVVEVLLTARPGTAPAAIKKYAVEVASATPASK